MPAPRKAAMGGYPVPRKRRTNANRQFRQIDHKNIALISRYVNELGQIQPRKRNGSSAVTQRVISQAIKRARILALLPFIKR